MQLWFKLLNRTPVKIRSTFHPIKLFQVSFFEVLLKPDRVFEHYTEHTEQRERYLQQRSASTEKWIPLQPQGLCPLISIYIYNRVFLQFTLTTGLLLLYDKITRLIIISNPVRYRFKRWTAVLREAQWWPSDVHLRECRLCNSGQVMAGFWFSQPATETQGTILERNQKGVRCERGGEEEKG